MQQPLTCVEICAGAGGQALGLAMAGFVHVALVEYEADYCKVLKENRPQENILPTGGVSSLLALLQILDILLCQLTGRLPALCAVWCVQLKTEPSFPDFKCKATVLVVIHQPALVRVLSRILVQTVFKGCIVGTHLNDRACLVKKDAGCLLLLGKTCSHKTSAFS